MDNDDKDFMRDGQEVAAAHFTGIGATLAEGRFSALGAVQAASQFTSVVERARQLATRHPCLNGALAASSHAVSIVEQARLLATGLPRFDATLAASSHAVSIAEQAGLFATGLPRFDATLAASSHAVSIVEQARLFAAGLPRFDAALTASGHFASIVEQARLLATGLPRFDAAFTASSQTASIVENARVFAAGLSRVDISGLSATQFSAMQSALARFGTIGAEMFSNIESRSALYQAVEEFSLSSVDYDHIEDDFNKSVDQFEKANDQASYFSAFKRLPKIVQLLILFFFFDVFISQLNSISANFITDLIKPYVFDEKISQREKIKEIKNRAFYLKNFDTTGLRFITGNNVRLRLEPSIKSEVLGELMLGQVVTVVSKNKNWIEVIYECEDGTLLTGWVFTRYTSRFVK